MKRITLALLASSAMLFSCRAASDDNATAADSVAGEAADNAALAERNIDPNRTFSFVGCGDILLGLNYPEGTKRFTAKDGADLLDGVTDIIKGADVAMGNLEGVLLDKGGTPKNCGGDPSHCFTFRMPERYVNHLVNAGFDLISIANNHGRDFGPSGQQSTMRVLREAGLAYAGVKDVCETDTIHRSGLVVGFIAVAPHTSMLSNRDYDYVASLVKRLKGAAGCDIVVVSMHAGAEGTSHTHVTRQDEMFLGANRGNVYRFAHEMIDAGADIVFGHGPHVVRAVELYKDRFIAYSMGNFCTPFGISKAGKTGYAPLIRVDVDGKGRFVGGRIFSALQKGASGPRLDNTGIVVKEIRSLSSADIPESPLTIADDGTMKKN